MTTRWPAGHWNARKDVRTSQLGQGSLSSPGPDTDGFPRWCLRPLSSPGSSAGPGLRSLRPAPESRPLGAARLLDSDPRRVPRARGPPGLPKSEALTYSSLRGRGLSGILKTKGKSTAGQVAGGKSRRSRRFSRSVLSARRPAQAALREAAVSRRPERNRALRRNPRSPHPRLPLLRSNSCPGGLRRFL